MDHGRSILVLGRMPRGAEPETHRPAGPWCFVEQEEFFPAWDRRFTFPPEPLAEVSAMERACRRAKALCADSIAPLAAELCPHSASLPATYWETLLAPWAVNMASQIVERWDRVKSMAEVWGNDALHVPLLPPDCRFTFHTEPDFALHGALGHTFNHWLFSRLFEALFHEGWPQNWTWEYLEPVNREYGAAKCLSGKERLRGILRNAMLRLPFPRLKGVRLGQSLRFSLALLHKSRGHDCSQPLSSYGRAATGYDAALPEHLDVMALFRAGMPRSLKKLDHPKRLSPGVLAPRLRVASILAYEDAEYRQKLALWRGRGHRLMYVQHGGNYGQVRCACDTAVVEYSQHAFATWGWSEHGSSRGNFIPLPYPQLARIKKRWHGQDGHNLLFVGTEMPAYGYRLDAHPTPLQLVDYRRDKLRFFESLEKSIRGSSLYRPYFPLPGSLRDADWLLERMPQVRLATGPLQPQMLACRLLVVDHNCTTTLEALVANVPTILFWRRDVWPVTPQSDALLDVLVRAGILYATPEEAAAKVAEVWEDPRAWWSRTSVQDARRAFCALQALTLKGDENHYWISTLKSL